MRGAAPPKGYALWNPDLKAPVITGAFLHAFLLATLKKGSSARGQKHSGQTYTMKYTKARFFAATRQFTVTVTHKKALD